MKGRHLEDEKISWLAFAACAITYIVISITRNAYSPAIAAITQEGLFSKERAGIISASFYLFYGCMQFFGGFLCDRFSPFKILLIGLTGSLFCNIGMALSSSFVPMLILWTLSGVAQFGVWPSIIKVVASVIIPEHRQKSMLLISFTYTTGAIISYLTALVVLKISSWQSLFWTSSVVLLLCGIFVMYAEIRINSNLVEDEQIFPAEQDASKQVKKAPVPLWRLIFTTGLAFLFIPGLVRSVLDVGLSGWVPTMIIENYNHISPSFASLLTAILFAVRLFAIYLLNWLYPHRCRNVVTAMCIFFVVTLPFIGMIILIGKVPVVLAVLALALIITFMTAASQVTNVIIPATFAKQGKTGAISGILNTFGAFGCMAGSYMYGYIAEHFNWTATGIMSFFLVVVAILFILCATPLWKRFSEKNL